MDTLQCQRFARNYENFEIEVDGSKYYVKLTDNLELEFEKSGNESLKILWAIDIMYKTNNFFERFFIRCRF